MLLIVLLLYAVLLYAAPVKNDLLSKDMSTYMMRYLNVHDLHQLSLTNKHHLSMLPIFSKKINIEQELLKEQLSESDERLLAHFIKQTNVSLNAETNWLIFAIKKNWTNVAQKLAKKGILPENKIELYQCILDYQAYWIFPLIMDSLPAHIGNVYPKETLKLYSLGFEKDNLEMGRWTKCILSQEMNEEAILNVMIEKRAHVLISQTFHLFRNPNLIIEQSPLFLSRLTKYIINKKPKRAHTVLLLLHGVFLTNQTVFRMTKDIIYRHLAKVQQMSHWTVKPLLQYYSDLECTVFDTEWWTILLLPFNHLDHGFKNGMLPYVRKLKGLNNYQLETLGTRLLDIIALTITNDEYVFQRDVIVALYQRHLWTLSQITHLVDQCLLHSLHVGQMHGLIEARQWILSNEKRSSWRKDKNC